jgi:hypothetical protein
MENHDSRQFEQSSFGRRSSDYNPQPSLADVMAAINSVQTQVSEIRSGIKGIESGFPRNDLGAPDFDGHRRDHLQRIKIDKTVENFKLHAATKLGLWVMAILGAILVTGLSEHLKRFVGAN